jgi:hypothetical protein
MNRRHGPDRYCDELVILRVFFVDSRVDPIKMPLAM